MLQYKTLLAESKTPLLLAQKEIASLQKELDGFRKAVDAKAKERDAMEREAKFAKAETEKVAVSVLTPSTRAVRPHAVAATPPESVPASREPRDGPKRPKIDRETTHATVRWPRVVSMK